MHKYVTVSVCVCVCVCVCMYMCVYVCVCYCNFFSVMEQSLEKVSNPTTVAVTPSNKPLNQFANITVCKLSTIQFVALYHSHTVLSHTHILTLISLSQVQLTKTQVDFWRLELASQATSLLP